jgi:hypothetical protein
MVTEKKIAANARNATRSTGPRTSSGKTRAKLNAVVHGLRTVSPVLPGESVEDWNSFRTGVIATLAPSGALETELADRVALLMWRLRRVVGYETAVTVAEQDIACAIVRGEPDPSEELISAQQLQTSFGECTQFTIGPRTQFTVRGDLESARNNAAEFAAVRDAFRRRASLSPARPIAGDEACRLFRRAAEVVSNCTTKYHTHDHDFPRSESEFLGPLGVPKEWHAEPGLWNGWTGRLVRRGLEALAKDAGMNAAAIIERADRLAEVERRKAETLEVEWKKLAAEAADAEKAARAETVLPSATVLDQVMRYESHLNRQLSQTIHLLERLQATRAGSPPVPAAALDVTIEARG